MAVEDDGVCVQLLSLSLSLGLGFGSAEDAIYGGARARC